MSTDAFAVATSPPRRFDDCLALLDRADVHIAALDEILKAFFARSPYRLDTHIDLGTIPRTVGESTADKEIVLIGRIRETPPLREAGILVFDAVNSLRAALDHCIWILSTERHSAPARVARGSPWRKVGWPVAHTSAEGGRSLVSRLQYVSDSAAVDTIMNYQPFRRREREPEADEFAVLDELWNIHKHRHIRLTEFWVGLDTVASRLAQTQVFDAPRGYADVVRERLAGHGYKIVRQRPPGPFEDGAELGRVQETGPLYSVFAEFDVHAYLAVEIAFDKGSPAYGGPVLQTLRKIRVEVASAIEALGRLI